MAAQDTGVNAPGRRPEHPVIGPLLSLLRLRRFSDEEEIAAIRRAWLEMDIEWDRGRWHAYPLNGTGKTLSGRTPYELRAAILDAWAAS